MAFSYNRALAPTSDFRSYISSIKEVKAVDPLTVHIITNGPNPILPDYATSIMIMSKAWAEKHNVTKPQSYKDKEETYAVRNAMGTGPYTLKQRDPDVKTVMAKNPTYWGAKDFPAYPDELVYTPIKEPVDARGRADLGPGRLRARRAPAGHRPHQADGRAQDRGDRRRSARSSSASTWVRPS